MLCLHFCVVRVSLSDASHARGQASETPPLLLSDDSGKKNLKKECVLVSVSISRPERVPPRICGRSSSSPVSVCFFWSQPGSLLSFAKASSVATMAGEASIDQSLACIARRVAASLSSAGKTGMSVSIFRLHRLQRPHGSRCSPVSCVLSALDSTRNCWLSWRSRPSRQQKWHNSDAR